MAKCEDHSGIITDIKNLKESDRLQWVAINNIRNRLPAWGTVIISLLTFLCGVSFTYAAMK
jgi:hypothetical protein